MLVKNEYEGRHRLAPGRVQVAKASKMVWRTFEEIWRDCRRAQRALAKDLERRQKRRTIYA